MIASLLITLREGLEAALIVGIILSLLGQLDQQRYSRDVWLGVGAAAAVSLGVGFALNRIGLAFEGRGEEIFEGIMMLIAAGVLTWMIFWMRRQGREVQSQLASDVREAVNVGSRWALLTLAFVAVVREGIETALFLTATSMSSSAGQSLLGGLIGLAAAVGLGWLIFAGGKRLNIGAFFRVTSVILLIVAAGLFAHGVHELQEAAILPVVVEHVWDINHILSEGETVGLFLSALVGYNGNPSLIEVITYVSYIMIVVLAWQLFKQRQTPSATAA
jgi:high-affinity iron transporter